MPPLHPPALNKSPRLAQTSSPCYAIPNACPQPRRKSARGKPRESTQGSVAAPVGRFRFNRSDMSSDKERELERERERERDRGHERRKADVEPEDPRRRNGLDPDKKSWKDRDDKK